MWVLVPAEATVYPWKMHTVFALLCFVVVIHWLIFPYPSGNLTIAPVPAKQPWWIWINTSCEFIKNDCITTTKQSTTKTCAYFLGYTVYCHYHFQKWYFVMLCMWYYTKLPFIVLNWNDKILQSLKPPIITNQISSPPPVPYICISESVQHWFK